MNSIESHIRNNLYEFYRQTASACNMRSEKFDGWSVVQNCPGFWPNLIYNIGSELITEQNAPIFNQKIRAGSYPNLLISGDENIQQTDPFFRKHGFYPITVWKGMALERSSEQNEPGLPGPVSISKPETEAELEQWMTIVNEELLSSEKLDKSQMQSILSQPNFEAWLLKTSGEAVSTILTFRTGSSTGLYFVATQKSAQRQGFASLLVRQICAQEAKSSEKPIVLHATRNGETVYSKLGFKPYNSFFLYWKINKDR